MLCSNSLTRRRSCDHHKSLGAEFPWGVAMREFTYFILGVLVSIPIAVLAPFLTTRMQNRFAMRSKRQANLRADAIQRDFAEVKNYHDDPIKLLRYISTKILWLTVLWIGQNIIDVIFGFVSNASYLASMDIGYLTSLNFNQISS